MSTPVIVGYDGTDASRAALLWALEEADAQEQVIPVAILGHEPSPLPVLSGVPGPPDERSRVAARTAACWDEDGAPFRGLMTLRFSHGSPAEGLAAAADSEDARLIVIGHHRGRHLKPLRASIAGHLPRLASCPVVVVP